MLLQIQNVHYENKVIDVNVNPGEITEVNAVLRPAPSFHSPVAIANGTLSSM